ncbi:hypothetical protein HYE53_05440 [Aggregatibacter actinomycetemcomitans]|nr:hypothetical protein [Aggregatibacter actinomycetemcomitans]
MIRWLAVNKCCCIDVDKFIEEYKSKHSDIGWYDKNKATGKYEKINLPKFNSQSENNLRRLIKGIIDYYSQSDYEKCNIPRLAYMLATIRVESYDWRKRVFFGILEEDISYAKAEVDYGCGLTARRAGLARKNGCRVDGDGYKYRGRGFVQITWRINYEKFNGINGINFGLEPEKIMDFDTLIKVTVDGMEKGIFVKGETLSKYINAEKKDYKSARRIINGQDKDWIIAEYAQGIEECLINAKK